jgi:hypothetical protein
MIMFVWRIHRHSPSVGEFAWAVYARLQGSDRTAPTNQLMFFVELVSKAEA